MAKEMGEEEIAGGDDSDGTYFPPKVSRLSRGGEASLSLNVGQSFDCGNGHFSY